MPPGLAESPLTGDNGLLKVLVEAAGWAGVVGLAAAASPAIARTVAGMLAGYPA